MLSSSTRLVRCGKCKFSFHDNIGDIDTCPRCNITLNPHSNLVQAGIPTRQRSTKDEALMNLTRVLAFGFGRPEQKNKGLSNVPLGLNPIDKQFTFSKPRRQQSGKQLQDLERLLKEF